MSNYWQNKMNDLNKSTASTPSKTSTSTQSTGGYWNNKMVELNKTTGLNSDYRKMQVKLHKKKWKEWKESQEDIAPVKERKWFDKGLFDDGYDFGDVTKTILGTMGDVGENLLTGVIDMGEKIVDAGAYIAPYFIQGGATMGGDYQTVEQLEMYQQMADEAKKKSAEFIKKDLYDAEEVTKKILSSTHPYSKDFESYDEYSVLGEKSDALVQSGGQLAATLGLQAVGVPWFVTTGVTSFGGEAENALNEGATYGEAGVSAAITAGADILTEKISGGIKFGGKAMDDVLTNALARGVSNKFIRTASRLGLDMVGEGAEEWLAQDISSFGKWLTYQDEETLKELLFSEEAMQEKIEAFIGGAALGGVMGGGKAIQSKQSGRDYVSGLTKNEQTVVDAVYKELVAEAEKNGDKKKKSEIYDEVLDLMDKGQISTAKIEELLGGDSYKALQSIIEEEEGSLNELSELYQGDELKARIEEFMNASKRTEAQTELSKKVAEMVSGDRLLESYMERGRVGEKYDVDLSQYDESVRVVYENAINSGVLNNTRRSHELVDLSAKLYADKGVLVDFMNNERIKSSGFGVEGKIVDGYKVEDGRFAVNVQSPKYLNRVVGHELTHVFEGTSFYDALAETVFEYAKAKGAYETDLKELDGRYRGVQGYGGKDGLDKIKKELVANYVGDYLFTDTEFINKLSTENRSLFEKIWDEIKYFCKIATAGSKEARELERVRKAFEDAYRKIDKFSHDASNNGNTQNAPHTTDTSHSIIEDMLNSKRVNNTLANEVINNPELGKAFTDITGITLTGTREDKRQMIRDAVNMRHVLNAENEAIAKETAERAEIESEYINNGLTAYVRGFITGGATVADAREILGDPEMKAEWERLTGKTLPENEKSAIKMIRETKRKLSNVETPVQYSLSDSDGNQLSKGQQEYFKDSKVRDDNGNLKVMYHGSQSAGYHTFDSRFSDDGISLFFVDKNNVASTYSGSSEVYKARTFNNAKEMNKFFAEIGHDDYEVFSHNGKHTLYYDTDDVVATSDSLADIYEAFCDFAGVGEGRANYQVYLNMVNPLEVDAHGKHWNQLPGVSDKSMYDYIKVVDVGDATGQVTIEYAMNGEQAPITETVDLYEKFPEGLAAALSDLAPGEQVEGIYANPATTREYAVYAKENGYDGVLFKNIVDLGEYASGREGAATVAIAFDSNQIKSTANANPTGNADIRYSLSGEVSEEQNARGLDRRSEVQYSLSNDTAYMDKAIAMNQSVNRIDYTVMQDAKVLREKIAGMMNAIKDDGLVGIPDDIEGNTYIANSSYDGTEENTTICPRSLASEAFVDAVSEYLGRPLTVEEQIYISQDLQGRTLTPECLYCYVATDRKAYRAFLGDYISQRDSVLKKLGETPNVDVSRSSELYTEFLNGRKDTNPMYNRFKMWVDAYKNGTPMIEASHLANISKLMGDINSEFGAELKPQIVDAMKYAQSASWAKKRINYVAYNGHILKWKQDRINKLNSHYGLRMYSFSDFHPAFVLENMQMITDASVRGLKMLGYTKDTDFVDIFAPTGMNINVSTFGFESNGEVFENNITGASWETAKALREQYPNVGITFVATNDTLVEWALAQAWIDVVIPFHLVRTGKEVAKALKYTDYTSESSDTKAPEWKKGDKKYIAPTEHNNDKATYLAALEKNHLRPRFARFIDNPNYMKLVNECRQPASESKPVQPVFNEEAAMSALAKLAVNGYYQPIGGSVDRMYEIAAEVADTMTSQIAPTYSLSNSDEEISPHSYTEISGRDVAYDPSVNQDIAPLGERPAIGKKPTNIAPTPNAPKQNSTAKVLTEEPESDKKKFKPWSMFKEHFLDNGMVFEEISKKTKNRELEAKWNYIRNAESAAQHKIGKDLQALTDKVEKSGKTEKFYNYLLHLHNVDRMTLADRYPGSQNKAVFGDTETANISKVKAAALERANPEFKEWAKEVYAYNEGLRDMLVENDIITQETADLWAEMYPHYVPTYRVGDDAVTVRKNGKVSVNAPIKQATGGNQQIRPLFNVMAERTLQTYKAIAKNNFGVELMHTLDSAVVENETNVDDFTESLEMNDLLSDGGGKPTFTVFEGGKKVTFRITDEMYEAMKPKSQALSSSIPVVSHVNSIFRGLTTQYNPLFALTNPIKDIQDVLMNSQHAGKTYANVPRAIKEMASNGKYYQEYLENGGKNNTYFDDDSKVFGSTDSKAKQTLDKIFSFNEYIEMTPRLAEYIASREAGRSVEVSMLDAARVTTNFAAGGDITKFANRNGATFLNASVQGAIQQMRNVREAHDRGALGYVGLLARFAIAGVPALLNNVLWDDDEEYEELSDYVKQGYYIVGKYDDGRFIRIPKGRALAVVQEAVEVVEDLSTGDDEVDMARFLALGKLGLENLAPNNPFTNNILAPITQAKNNKTWYGEDLVPTRLQDLPAVEQYDEKTDSISIWLSESINELTNGKTISPYKLNYLFNQYSGGIGDFFLPMLTQRAESGTDSFAGNLIAPFRDKFTTDSVLNNQVVSDFYDKMDELEVLANSRDATEEDSMRQLYMQSVSYETGDLYAQKREIQNSDLPDSEKYELVRDIQKQINDIMENAMSGYNDVSIQGIYSEVGDRRYNFSEENGRWYEIKPTNADGEDNYFYQQEQKVTKALDIGYADYWNNREEYDFAYDHPDKNAIAKLVGGYDSWVRYYGDNPRYPYYGELSGIKADKDKNGKSISGTKKAKVLDYINNLDVDWYEKIILYKSMYNSDDTYNKDIIEYIIGREDLSYDEKVDAFKYLGFKVDKEGYVSW